MQSASANNPGPKPNHAANITAQSIVDAMGSVCSNLVRTSATVIATATDKTAIAYRKIADGSDDSKKRGFDMSVAPRTSNAARDIPHFAALSVTS